MANAPTDIGRAALTAALARAGRRASTAAAVAAIVPLAIAVTTPPAEAFTVSYTVTGGTPTPIGGGVFDYSYTFHAPGNAQPVSQIELPEAQAGEFLTGAEGNFLGTIPTGWTVTQQAASALGTGAATFKAPNAGRKPAAFIELTWGGQINPLNNGGGSGSSLTFTLESAFVSTIASNASVEFPLGEGSFVQSIDPPTPAPEPGTLALLGGALAGLLRIRSRKPG